MNAPAFTITPQQASEIAAIERKLVPGRNCGTCSLCCKVMRIAELDKPAGRWCAQIRKGAGCAIYQTRPFGCRAYYCDWMISKGLGDEWKPDKAKFALFVTNEGRRLTAHVDPGFPAAWKRTPYYENFKIWAAKGLERDPIHIVDVMIGDHVTVVLPDREVEIGTIGADEAIEISRAAGAVNLRLVKRTPSAA